MEPTLIVICAIFGVSLCAPAQNDVISMLTFHPAVQVSFDDHWLAYKMKHEKTYPVEQEEYRKKVFRANMEVIEQHNVRHRQGLVSYRLGINHFTDWTNKEFRQTMNGFQPRANLSALQTDDRLSYLSPVMDLALPKSVDYRKKGYVTEVKNQGACGSCWSFSATGALEGQHFRQTGRLVSLSEQNLVDCSTSWGNNGCNGGLMDNAFQYIKDNRGIDTEAAYPYDAADETCKYKKSEIGATDKGFTDIDQGNEKKLAEALALNGPISIAIDAGHSSFQMYESGVYVEPECSPTQLDHGVLAVGYGTTDEGQDYWIVKNSWGEQWGESGYIRMARNLDNQCGVASEASYPNV